MVSTMKLKAEDDKSLDQLPSYIWINGEFVENKNAKLHAMTHSLHYSGAVFEGERAYNGKIFKLDEHVERLINSAKDMRLKINYSADEIIKAHNELLIKNNVGDAYIRPLIWRGDESLNLVNNALSTNLLIASVPSSIRKSIPLKLHVGKWCKPPINSLPPQVKGSGHYAMALVTLEDAIELGYDDALLLDYRGYIAECTATNIFFVKGDELITPIADAFLNGITRLTIIELAKTLGIKTKEQYITLDQLKEYDGCFLTGTASEIKLVNSIYVDDFKENFAFEEYSIGDLLKKEYANLVRK
jgi:branched-chain amino acid aminotransferase